MGLGEALKPTRKLSERQANAAIQRLVARIRNSATRLPDGPGEKERRVATAERDFWSFARLYFPHHFTADSAAMHYELLVDWQEPGVNVDRLPRGFAKTTLGQIFALWCTLFGKRKFGLIIGKTSDTAFEILSTIVIELEENERLRQDFGEQTTDFWSRDGGFRLRRSGAWLLAIGRGEPVRGRKKGASRPDLVIADDIEDEELVRNARRVRALLKWWLMSVLPGLADGGTAIWLCTSLAAKGPSTLLLDERWVFDEAEEPPLCRRRSYPALNADEDSTWPAVWPTARLRAKRAEIGTRAFNQEFLHKAEPAGAMFHSGWLQFYDPIQLPAGAVTVLACDPAAKAQSANDTKAVVAWAKDLKTDRYYCRYAWIRRESINAMVAVLYDLFMLLRPQVEILELISFADLLRIPIDLEGEKRRIRLPIKALDRQVKAKAVRIQSLQPLAENGQLFFAKGHSDQDILREQFEYYGTGSMEDDGPDATEMALRYLRPLRDERPNEMLYESVEGSGAWREL